MKIPKYEQNLDRLFNAAFSVNQQPLIDYAQLKLELKSLRNKVAKEQANSPDAKSSAGD